MRGKPLKAAIGKKSVFIFLCQYQTKPKIYVFLKNEAKLSLYKLIESII